VVVSTTISCGKCDFCKTGNRYSCPEIGEIGYTPYQGGYAEYLCVPEDNLYILPDNVSFRVGGIFEGFMCPFGAVYDLGGLVGQKVLIFGAGSAGLVFAAVAKSAGASKVIIAARNKARLAHAKSFGADIVADLESDDIRNVIMGETNGLGADVVIEAAGFPQSAADSVKYAKSGGVILLYGLAGTDVPIPINDIVTKTLTVIGTMGNPNVWQKALDMLESGRFALDGLVTHSFPLEKFNEAFDLVKNKRGGVIKAVIEP